MRKRKVYKGRRGQGAMHLPIRKKKAHVQRHAVRDERASLGAYLSSGNLRR